MNLLTLLFGAAVIVPPPGALNPAVTQQTIHQTICVPGWTATIRPPTAYTQTLKQKQLAAGLPHARLKDYEEDHFIPLELGGHPKDVNNLWPELWASAHADDRMENALHQQVCSGRVTLEAAQHKIAEIKRSAQKGAQQNRQTEKDQ